MAPLCTQLRGHSHACMSRVLDLGYSIFRMIVDTSKPIQLGLALARFVLLATPHVVSPRDI